MKRELQTSSSTDLQIARLMEDMSGGTEVQVQFVRWDYGASEWIDTNVVVYATDPTATLSFNTGDLCWITFDSEWERYALVGPGGEGSSGTKPLIEFELTTILTGSPDAQANILNQFGAGADNPSTTCTVHNLESQVPNDYVFVGNPNSRGIAYLNNGTSYRIIQMECGRTTIGVFQGLPESGIQGELIYNENDGGLYIWLDNGGYFGQGAWIRINNTSSW